MEVSIDPCNDPRQGGVGGSREDRPARRSCAGAGPPPRQDSGSRPSRSRDLPRRSGLTREHRPGDAGRLEGGSRHPAGSLTGAERDRQCREGWYRARRQDHQQGRRALADRPPPHPERDRGRAGRLSTLLHPSAQQRLHAELPDDGAGDSPHQHLGHGDVRDVAAGAAEIAVSPAAHAGKTYWPTGPESLSGNDVAEIFTKVLGRLITFYPISYEEQKQAMIDVGLPEPVAKDNALAVAWMADGDCDYVTEDLPQILGRPAGSFERFAIDYAEAFS